VDSAPEVDAKVLTFEKAVTCVFGVQQVPRPYLYTSGPYSGGQIAFGNFLKRLASRR